jgi:hypothetical protein
MFEVSCHTSICAQYRSRYAFVKARQLYQGNRGRPAGDDGTADVIVNDVVRWNQLPFSFVAGHLVNALLVQAVSRGCVAAG